MNYLLWASRSNRENAIVVRPGRVIRVGRNPANDIIVRSPKASRFHVLIFHDGAAIRVRDDGSRYGFRFNGQPGTTETPLSPGDRLEVVGTQLWVESLPTIEPAWLAWNDGTVPRLAQSIRDRQAFRPVHLLADALEDAGCGDAWLLDSLRAPSSSARTSCVIGMLTGTL